MSKLFRVYILASLSRALYVGITSDLQGRVFQHRNGLTPGHTTRYQITRLVYFEATEDAYVAISREKQIKGWRREKKVSLIEASNPSWEDLAADWYR